MKSRHSLNYFAYLPVDELAVIWMSRAICCLSDIGVFEFDLGWVAPVLNPIPFGLGGGILFCSVLDGKN